MISYNNDTLVFSVLHSIKSTFINLLPFNLIFDDHFVCKVKGWYRESTPAVIPDLQNKFKSKIFGKYFRLLSYKSKEKCLLVYMLSNSSKY